MQYTYISATLSGCSRIAESQNWLLHDVSVSPMRRIVGINYVGRQSSVIITDHQLLHPAPSHLKLIKHHLVSVSL